MSRSAHRPQRVVPIWSVLTGVGLALVTVVASTTFLMRPPQTVQEFAVGTVPTVSTDTAQAASAAPARGLHLYLLPHPDDELSGWTSLVDGSDLYPVLVLLTQGEATTRCSADAMTRHLSTALGEIAPTPDPSTETATTQTCREARLNSFRQAIVEAAGHTPAVALDWSRAHTLEIEDHPTTIVPGRAATLLVLDLGDGTLTADRVESVVQDLLTSPRTGLPDLPLARVTSSAYYATEAAADRSECHHSVCAPGEPAYVYGHADHGAVQQAARALAPLTGEGSWLVTHPDDAAANHHLALSEEQYQEFMALGAGEPSEAERLGSYQRVYGWLAFPDAWRPGDLPLRDTQVLFPRVQSYEVVTP